MLALGCLAGAAAPASADMVELIASASPSVVAVGTFNALKSPRFSFRGTGFAVGNGNRIITNAHVVPKPNDPDADDKLVVIVPRGSNSVDEHAVIARRLDTDHDVAVLEIDGAPLPALKLNTGPTVPAGTEVALIGFPLGTTLGYLVPTTHRGIVSAVTVVALPPPTARQLDAATLARLRQGPFEVLQLDATAYHGNSGSPLLDGHSGRVIGIINGGVKATKESAVNQITGITYAIPVKFIAELLERQ